MDNTTIQTYAKSQVHETDRGLTIYHFVYAVINPRNLSCYTQIHFYYFTEIKQPIRKPHSDRW